MTETTEPALDKNEPLAIATSGLTKQYGSTTAVRDPDLAIGPRTINGFLSPNGAGKRRQFGC
jgi:ABC-2 type transport system ATP-binding protein